MGFRSPRLSPRSAARLAALCAVLAAPACMREKKVVEGPTPPAAVRAVGPSIVLLCLDTLRADAIQSAPDGTPWMPALSAFAREATAFTDAASSSSWTAPSVATILTGLESAHTGVRGARTAGVLPPSVTTLAESLQARGYSTGAITGGGWVVPSRGLGQGFDTFSASFDAAGPEAEIANWQRRRPKDEPFFLFLHTVAAHDPYGPKRTVEASEGIPWVAERAKEIAKATVAADWTLPEGAAPWLLSQFLFDLKGRETVRAAVGDEAMFRLWDLTMDWLDGAGRGSIAAAPVLDAAPDAYRKGLAYVDDVFARTMKTLAACGLPDDTVFVVCADHGEALGEHGTLSHGRWLYDELVRVPLLVKAPGRLPAGRVEGSCGLVDVTPTLLSLAGVPAPQGLDGASLLPLAAGTVRGRPVFAEEDRNTIIVSLNGWTTRTLSVRTEAAKYLITYDLVTNEVLRTELYDLASDPGERTSLDDEQIGRFGGAFCRAVSALKARVPGLPAAPACEVARSPEPVR